MLKNNWNEGLNIKEELNQLHKSEKPHEEFIFSQNILFGYQVQERFSLIFYDND